MKDENKNKMYTQPKYKCAICHTEHNSVQERATCEMKCLKHKQEEEKKAADAKKKAEQDAKFKEASNALDNAYALVNKCVEDYGHFIYDGKYKGLDLLNMDFFPSKLWHHFFF